MQCCRLIRLLKTENGIQGSRALKVTEKMEVRKEAITIQDVFRKLEVLCSKTFKKFS